MTNKNISGNSGTANESQPSDKDLRLMLDQLLQDEREQREAFIDGIEARFFEGEATA